ncbi:cytochrome P450 [Streptomyces pactum]|uniref:Cytochrome P450 n=1 Tax=Streptomyces pactum TaxID=68249 RepID=A0A1S6J3L8_9ACTN|nr:cytochrome P450 [Streptomyces pactum]AQS66356.1 cytochrome P450 [Streptomyces pactum]
MAPACEPLPVQLGAPSTADPHARYARLREAGPVHPARLPDGTVCWLVTRYEEARKALAHPCLSTDPAHASPKYEHPPWEHGPPQALLAEAAGRHVLHSDPPAHDRLRNLVNRAFGTPRSAFWRRDVERIVDGALARLAGRDEPELLSGFALPVALAVISEVLGVPHALRARLEESAEALVTVGGRPATPNAARAAAGEVIRLMTGLFREKRAAPADDLLSDLASAADEEGGPLDEGDLIATACLLLFTGYETVAYALCNSVINLLVRPDQLAAARASPALLASAIDELLRFEGPGDSAALRYTTASVRLGDVDIPRGECVLVSIQSANRDRCRFAEPERLDISREPGDHLAFGHGIHHCVGAPLARLEIEVALHRLLTRFPALRLAVDATELEWHHLMPLRSARSLPVRL